MSAWQLIFSQSKVNNGFYDGDRLVSQNWEWPKKTWFQNRLRDLRKRDALTEALEGFAGDANVRVVVVTGGAPGYFIRHFSVTVTPRP
jgi:hypothetical protein